LLDEQAITDIWGVLLLAVGIALAVAVVLSRTGVLAEAVAHGLGLILGIGRYVLPVILILMGVSFFVPSLRPAELRFAIGLTTFLCAVVGLVGLGAVGTGRVDTFAQTILVAHGGYVGNAIAWALERLLGSVIAGVLLVALALIGLIVTGLSLSKLFDWFAEKRAAAKEQRAHEAAQEAVQRPRTQRLSGTGATGGRKRPASSSFEDQPTTRLGADESQEDEEYDEDQTTELDGAHTAVLDQSDAALTQRTSAPRPQEDFELPPFDLLLMSTPDASASSKNAHAQQQATADALVDTLLLFDVQSRVVDWVVGPTVTLYKVEIAKGIRLNKVTTLADDLALALAAPTLRILAPIPGESLVGVEVPNDRRSSVTLGDILPPQDETPGPLLLGIGKDITGAGIVRDLAGMPHLLIGGSTGSGKSVAINAMIMSIIMRATPAEVRMIMIDPKRVELSIFNGLPHLYVPVVTTPKEAASALAWAVSEMDRRLRLLEKAKVRNIGEYNHQWGEGNLDEGAKELPYLVVIIDELADLMMVAAKEVESSIVRIAQLARAAGIHLIVATQRPDANVVTPLIKANITNRIGFRTATAIDSRVVLDQSGAEQLTGLGDMLFSIPAWPHPKRIQGCFVSEKEIEAVVNDLKEKSEPQYHDEIFATLMPTAGGAAADEGDDPLLWEAAEMVIMAGFGSTSGIQRRFKVGYSRAGRIMDMLQTRGVVGPPDGSKPREVLIDSEGLARLMSIEAGEDDDDDDTR